ncbi:MAG: hypothetical protein IPM82_25185 [Saprospiraceae bacterium]|nr:hypothetical protein [Saprospiraceae bacterium]
MKATSKILAIAASLVAAAWLFSCKVDSDDWFEPDLQRWNLKGVVTDAQTDKPVKGVYFALYKGQNCEWQSGGENYTKFDDSYSSNDGNFEMSYYGSRFADFVVRKGRVSVFVDSLNAYKKATVERYLCPALSNFWIETSTDPAYNYRIDLTKHSNLDIQVELKFDDN